MLFEGNGRPRRTTLFDLAIDHQTFFLLISDFMFRSRDLC